MSTNTMTKRVPSVRGSSESSKKLRVGRKEELCLYISFDELYSVRFAERALERKRERGREQQGRMWPPRVLEATGDELEKNRVV